MNRILTTISVVLSSIGLLGVAGLAQPESAYAAVPAPCGVGYACIWIDTDYRGSIYWKQSANEQAVPSRINNRASSAAANGGSCAATLFYDNSQANTGSYLKLHSRKLTGTNYQDPDLSNGGGLGPYAKQNWDNRISRIKFVGCP